MIEGWPGTPYICTPEGRAAFLRWVKAPRTAEAGEAGTAETVKQGSVHEHAVAKRCAHD